MTTTKPPNDPDLGQVESAALRSLVAARLLGLIHPDLDAVAVAAVRSTARAVDAADTPGAAAYASAVLGRLLRDTGLDPKTTRRIVEQVDRDRLTAAVIAELDQAGSPSARHVSPRPPAGMTTT